MQAKTYRIIGLSDVVFISNLSNVYTVMHDFSCHLYRMDNTNNMYGSQCTQLGNALDMAEDGEGYGLVTMVTEDHCEYQK